MKKLTIPADNLRQALAKLSQAINIKNSLPALVNVYCKVANNKIELIGTDLDISIFYTLECQAISEFEFLLPFEFLTKIVSINKGQLLEITAGKTIKISCNNDSYDVMPNSKINDYPKLQEFPLSNINTINADIVSALHAAIATTSTVVQPVFAFVVLDVFKEKMIVASTDANILFAREFNNENGLLEDEKKSNEKLLLSQKVIKAITGCSEAKIAFNEKNFGIDTGAMRIIVTRSELKFPEYSKIFPTEFEPNFFVNRYELIDVLQKCSLTSDPFNNTKFDFSKDDKVKLSAKDDMLNIDVEINADNKVGNVATHININSERMLKLMHQIEVENIDITIQGSTRAVLITSKELAGYKAMIMPLHQN